MVKSTPVPGQKKEESAIDGRNGVDDAWQKQLADGAGACWGSDFWHTKAVDRYGIPKVMMCDGHHGLRKQKGEGDHLGINESIEAVCIPTASALSASFDRDLLYQLGEISFSTKITSIC